MSRREKYGCRDLTYSAWHRNLPEDELKVIDLDNTLWVEFKDGTKEILAFIEEAQDVGQYKPTTISAKVGKRANVPVYRLLWKKEKSPMATVECPMCNGTGEYPLYDIIQFKTKLVHPNLGEEKILTPKEWHDHLNGLRRQSERQKRQKEYNLTFWALDEVGVKQRNEKT